jgi:hypothetical protein
LVWICDPVITISADALIPNVDVACVSNCLLSDLMPSLVPTFSAFECMITFCFAITWMSPVFEMILTTLLTESRMIWFCFESTIVTFSDPSLSSKMIR